MKRKLTLTVEEEAILKVKRLAKRQGLSVSSLFEKWLLSASASGHRPSLGTRLRGNWKDYQSLESDPRMDFLIDKHGK
ncbi:MAG: DUF6364 family protein [Verrucomicrobiota bacterium]